jgi:putative transposase
VRRICKVIGVTAQGYYAWLKRGESVRDARNRELETEIEEIHRESKCTYGSPRIYKALKEKQIRCSMNRVALLMQKSGIRAKAGRKFKVTTDSSRSNFKAPDLLERDFSVDAPNRKWVSDITYLWTAEGWLYLAVVIDLFSRKVVGWATSKRIRSSLVILAFERAVARRKPEPGLIMHSDQGSQYASKEYRRVLRDAQVLQSMGTRGDCFDNAVAESFFHSFKIEAIYGADIQTYREMEHVLFDYIERFYNKNRMHSYIEYLAPEKYEEVFFNNKKRA